MNLVTIGKNLLFFLFISCSSYEQFERANRDLRIPNRVYRANYQTTWSATVAVLSQFDIEEQNNEAGIIKTRWIENTAQLNFSDSFDQSQSVQSARFKLVVNVSKGTLGGQEVGRVSIYKRQVVERDFLEGWSATENDNILEKTLLYRIGRVIAIEQEIEGLQKQKEKEAIEEFIDD